jgi:hypothetical protein
VQGPGKRPLHQAWLRGCPPPRLAPRLLLYAAAPGPTHQPWVNAAVAAGAESGRFASRPMANSELSISGRTAHVTQGRAGGRCAARLRRSRGASRGGGHERRSAHPCALLRYDLKIAAINQRLPDWPCPGLLVQGPGKRPPHRAWLRGCPPPRLAPRLLLYAAAPGPTHQPRVKAVRGAG